MLHRPDEPVVVRCEQRTYFLRRPTVADQATFRREILTAGARLHLRLDLLALIREGVQAILAEDDADRQRFVDLVLEAEGKILRHIADINTGALDEMTVEERTAAWRDVLSLPPDLVELSNIVRDHYRPYARAIADNAVHDEIAGRVAIELFLQDCEGLSVPFRRSFKGIPQELVDAMPVADLPLIYRAFVQALDLSEAEKKGSASPTSRPVTPNPSRGGSTKRRRTGRAPLNTDGT